MYRRGNISPSSQSLLVRVNIPPSDYLNFLDHPEPFPHSTRSKPEQGFVSLSHMQELKARELNAHVQDCKYGHAAKNRN